MSSSVIPYFLIAQIYEFLKARPEFLKKTNRIMVIDFLRELHNGPSSKFKVIEPYTVIGSFGNVDNIVISCAADFMDKKSFLDWLNRKLNNEVGLIRFG